MNALPAHLQNRQNKRQVAVQVHDGLGSGSIPSVSLKGNAFTLVDADGNNKPIDTRWLDCVIIDTNPGVSRTFWGLDEKGQPNQYVADSFLPPECFSDNGIGASTLASNPQSTNCRSCRMSQFNWPSKVDPTKRTSACRPTKKVAVLAFMKGETKPDGIYVGASAAEFPFALRIPVTSHEALRAYSQKFVNQAFDVSDVVTRISFVSGQVGQLEFEAVGFIDEDTSADIDDSLEEKKTDALIGRGDQVVKALPAPGGEQRPLPAQPAVALPTATTPRATQPQEPATPFSGTAATVSPSDASAATAKSGRGRPRKPKEEKPATPFGGPPEAAAVAPFAAPAQPAPATAPFAAQQQSHGIVSDAPAPTASMEQALDSLFKMPT